MDEMLFDWMTRIIAAGGSRRSALRVIIAASPLAILSASAEAKKNKKQNQKKKRKRKKKKGEAAQCLGGQPDRCGDTCTDLRSDSNNCGSCGSACANGESCVNGACACGTGRIVCEGGCVEGHCCDGANGVTCGAGEPCCSPNGCKDLRGNANHCGACGRLCPNGESCVNGNCSCGSGHVVCNGQCVEGDCCDGANGVTCGSGETCCPSNGCRDFQTDEEHCGDCGQAVLDGEECVDGLSVCPAGSIVCSEACVEGDCCVNGGATTCDPGFTCCGVDGCKRLEEDLDHCGGCGQSCTDSADKCVEGRCICTTNVDEAVCPLGYVCAPGGCRCPDDLLIPDGCGPCSIACPGNSKCVNNHCVCDADDEVYFDGSCVQCESTTPGIPLPGEGKCRSDTFGEYCHCDGGCCSGPGKCFVEVDRDGNDVREFCCDGENQVICGDQCCDATTCDAGCPRQTARYGSYRRPGR